MTQILVLLYMCLNPAPTPPQKSPSFHDKQWVVGSWRMCTAKNSSVTNEQVSGPVTQF